MMHGLGHHFGSTHIAAGISFPILQSLLRHGLNIMTMQYITILDAEKREVAGQIEKVFN